MKLSEIKDLAHEAKKQSLLASKWSSKPYKPTLPFLHSL